MKLRNTLLASLLGVACGPGAVPWAAADTLTPAATWVVEPAAAGENLPAAGRSLFDQLFAVARNGQSSIELPFPFSALLARLDAQLANDPGSAQPPAKRVLIPLGRSLQRTAAAPDYFAYPRVVVAVDAQPGSNFSPYLKDRLYIGYQEKSAVLEVISYNEAAGRFEFQLVKDYRAGGQPQVFYANRSLCFACHQNGSPIFSRALWDETNANPQVASLLAASGRHFYGIPVERGVDIPYAIDNATERANRFALTQRLWREGCGDSELPARRCRAGLFTAALRHALSSGQTWTPDAAFQQSVAKQLQVETQRRWPGGLAIGNPDLPNRNPLSELTTWPAERAARIARSHVAARFDPLAPRLPREIWQIDAPGAIGSLISELAEFVSASDRQRLENTLTRQTGSNTTRLSAACRIATKPATSRWSLQCAPPPGVAGPTLSGELSIVAGHPGGGRLSRIQLPAGTAINNVELKISGPPNALGTSFTPRFDQRLARTAEGHAISRLTLQYNASDLTTGQVNLEIREEFTAIEEAITALLDTPLGKTLFGSGVLPRTELLSAVLAQLGATAVPPCCQAAKNLPVPRLEAPAVVPGSSATTPAEVGQQAFYPYCATCHQTAETFPPNFLTGSNTQVASQLRHCAARLYVRLAMADIPLEHRDKTPMPPESMLPAFATDIANWRSSPSRAALLAQVSGWLRAESGQSPNLTQLLAGGYEALRPCLPVPQATEHKAAP